MGLKPHSVLFETDEHESGNLLYVLRQLGNEIARVAHTYIKPYP